MTDVNDSEFIESQVKIAHWHLDKADDADAQAGRYHIASARRAYQTLMEWLPTISLSGRRRVGLVGELARLRERLRACGEDV